MKDKDEPKRSAICSHQEAERPNTFQRADNTLPPSQDRRCPSRRRPPQHTPLLKPPAGGGRGQKHTVPRRGPRHHSGPLEATAGATDATSLPSRSAAKPSFPSDCRRGSRAGGWGSGGWVGGDDVGGEEEYF